MTTLALNCPLIHALCQLNAREKLGIIGSTVIQGHAPYLRSSHRDKYVHRDGWISVKRHRKSLFVPGWISKDERDVLRGWP
jgi:hypothetical protein